MPLDYRTTEPLAVRDGDYNTDELATFNLGTRYGESTWAVAAVASAGTRQGEIEMVTNLERHPDLAQDPRYPYLAIESTFIWLREQTAALGLRLVYFQCENGQHDAWPLPYFCVARALIAGPGFVPSDGVTYADEWSLDEAMAAHR